MRRCGEPKGGRKDKEVLSKERSFYGDYYDLPLSLFCCFKRLYKLDCTYFDSIFRLSVKENWFPEILVHFRG